MRADRLLSELLLLQAHGRLTGREIARRLEVSERTVHRDMEALSGARVPIFALRGSRGGWQLDEGWRTQVPALEESELRALLMAQPRIIGDPRLAAAAERALSKLMAALPGPMRERAVNIRQRLFVDTTAWYGTTENLSMLPTAQEAVARERKLEMYYKPSGRESGLRVVDPLGLVAKGSAWYLVAKTANGFRTYRVSRIERARILDKASERPADFDLAQYWTSSTKQFQDGWLRVSATLRLEPRAAEWVKSWRSTVSVQTNQADTEGWITLKLQFEHESEACFFVLGLGSRVEVMEPVSLRERVAAEVEKVVAQMKGPKKNPEDCRAR
jgi:predicted DNA-binding transcriptional regulator YafY